MSPHPQQRILAFDFGTCFIGMAIGNTLTQAPQALKSIKAKNGIPNWQVINDIINEWGIDLLVVGLPLHMDGTENTSSKLARKFTNRLHTQCKLPVELVDERLSSEEAKYLPEAIGDIHGRAAMLILNSWFHQTQINTL